MPFSSTSPAVLLQEAAPDGAPSMWVMLLGILAIFWFVAILPERRERKRKAAMLEELQKNDRVITTSGMYAQVAAVGEGDVTIKFESGDTRVKILKSAVATVLTKDDDSAS